MLSRALRAAGLRVTMPRLIMLAWLEAHPHSTAEAVGAGLRDQFGAVSTQAVYDMLAACTTAGLLRRIEPAGIQPGSSAGSETIIITSCAAGVAARKTSTVSPGLSRA